MDSMRASLREIRHIKYENSPMRGTTTMNSAQAMTCHV